jgi:tryptophan 2,3-dioxygenase
MSQDGKSATSYGEYLRIPELLRLQETVSDAHDELQFIIVHQVFELWFKLLIFELEALRDAIDRDDTAQAMHYLRRVQAGVRTITSSFEVIETMRPYDFLEFRSRLQPASGFQSMQFRELEFLSGAKDERYLALFEGAPRVRVQRRFDEPSVWQAYVAMLGRAGLGTSTDAELVASVMTILRAPDRHTLGPLTEELMQYDELFALWRSRHVLMTMRLIGSKPGTGQASVAKLVEAGYRQMGAGGVDYLKSTLPKMFFPLLWEARTFMNR